MDNFLITENRPPETELSIEEIKRIQSKVIETFTDLETIEQNGGVCTCSQIKFAYIRLRSQGLLRMATYANENKINTVEYWFPIETLHIVLAADYRNFTLEYLLTHNEGDHINMEGAAKA